MKYRVDLILKPQGTLNILRHVLCNMSSKDNLKLSIIGLKEGEAQRGATYLLNSNGSLKDNIVHEGDHPLINIFDTPVNVFPKNGVVFTDKIGANDFKKLYVTTSLDKKNEKEFYDGKTDISLYLKNNGEGLPEKSIVIDEEPPADIQEPVQEEELTDVQEPAQEPAQAEEEPSQEEEEEVFACPVEGCDKEYASKASLTRHMREKHPEVNNQ